MKESVTYQEIVEEGVVNGVVKGERRILLQLVRKRLGDPPPAIIKRIEAIDDESTLSTLADRLLDVSTWDDLLSGL